MARTVAALTVFGLVNQLQKSDWQPLYDSIEQNLTYTDEQKKAYVMQIDTLLENARNGNVKILGEFLVNAMKCAGLEMTEAYIILHNNDSREVWSEVEKRKVIELKPAHIHLCGKIKQIKGKPNPKALINNIAIACGVLPNFIEKPKAGRYAYDNMLAYLIHAKYPEKYQYPVSDVVTLLGKDYSSIEQERREAWERGAATIKKQAAVEGIDWLEEQILTGQISKSEIVLTDEYYNIYARNKRRCDDAFDTYGTRRAYKTMQALQNGEFKLTVFFITGKSGTGKSRFANRFIQTLINKSAVNGEPWRLCEAASSNPVDDYQGEEILRMDDVRGNAMSASDWLKLLDPYNITPSSARYSNKTVAARVIVITSEKDPIEFFYYTRTGGGDRSEALDQFIRRIQALVQVVPYGELFENNQYRISTSEKVGSHLVEVNNSVDKSTGKPVEVSMQYGFTNEKELIMDKAIETLVSTVIDNNGSNFQH